jgi:hypothetical protein
VLRLAFDCAAVAKSAHDVVDVGAEDRVSTTHVVDAVVAVTSVDDVASIAAQDGVVSVACIDRVSAAMPVACAPPEGSQIAAENC